MEEPIVTSMQGQETREPKPPHTEGAVHVAVTANAPDEKKRKLENDGFDNSDFGKVRALVKELRPFFMEVLHTPHSGDSKAAYEIRKRMKTMLELTKQLTETTSTLMPKKVDEQPLHGAVLKENAEKKVKVEKQTTQTQTSEVLAASGNSAIDTNQKVESKVLNKIRTEALSRGTFVVGGSPVGWNFLLYPGSKLVYYGRTKESVIASRASKKLVQKTPSTCSWELAIYFKHPAIMKALPLSSHLSGLFQLVIEDSIPISISSIIIMTYNYVYMP